MLNNKLVSEIKKLFLYKKVLFLVIIFYITIERSFLMIWKIFIAILILILLFFIFKNIIYHFIHTNLLDNKNDRSFGINSLSALNLISLLLAVLSLGFTIKSNLIDAVSKNIQQNGATYLVIFLIILIFAFYRMSVKDDKITFLEQQLDSDTKQLWKNYAELNEFYRQKTLDDSIKRFINTTPSVISVQRYHYRIMRSTNSLKIVINGDYTHIREGDDLNLVAQAYFKFNLDDVNTLMRAYAKTCISLNTRNENDDDYNELIDLFICLIKALKDISPSEYNDDHSFKFEMIKIIHPHLEDSLNMNIPLYLTEEQISSLNGRKSGIDIAMFILKGYLDIKIKYNQFDYKGLSDTKKSRMYSNIQITNKIGINYVYVLAHHPDKSWTQKRKIEKVNEDTEKFIQIAQAEIHFIK